MLILSKMGFRQNLRAMPRPEKAQGPGDMVRVFVEQDVEFRRDDPAALGDFLRVEIKRAGERAKQKNPDELAAGFR